MILSYLPNRSLFQLISVSCGNRLADLKLALDGKYITMNIYLPYFLREKIVKSFLHLAKSKLERNQFISVKLPQRMDLFAR